MQETVHGITYHNTHVPPLVASTLSADKAELTGVIRFDRATKTYPEDTPTPIACPNNMKAL